MHKIALNFDNKKPTIVTKGRDDQQGQQVAKFRIAGMTGGGNLILGFAISVSCRH